jgi:hypothetical protein
MMSSHTTKLEPAQKSSETIGRKIADYDLGITDESGENLTFSGVLQRVIADAKTAEAPAFEPCRMPGLPAANGKSHDNAAQYHDLVMLLVFPEALNAQRKAAAAAMAPEMIEGVAAKLATGSGWRGQAAPILRERIVPLFAELAQALESELAQGAVMPR